MTSRGKPAGRLAWLSLTPVIRDRLSQFFFFYGSFQQLSHLSSHAKQNPRTQKTPSVGCFFTGFFRPFFRCRSGLLYRIDFGRLIISGQTLI